MSKKRLKKNGQRHEGDRERDLDFITKYYCRGYSQQAIADLLNEDRQYEKPLSRQTISKDLKTVRKRWLESIKGELDEKLANELAKIDNVEFIAWREFENSRGPKLEVVYKKRGFTDDEGLEIEDLENSKLGKGFESVKDANESQGKKDSGSVFFEKNVKKIERVGDPKFLDLVFKCIAKRCELLGLSAKDDDNKLPEKVIVELLKAE